MSNRRKTWNDLSMAEKAEMMKVAVLNGITDLKEIRQRYNEFAEGGEFDEDYYYSAALPEVTITPQNRRIVNAAGNPYLEQAAQDYVNRAIQEESNIGFQAAQEGLSDAAKIAGPIVGAATLGAISPSIPGMLGIVGDASTYLTPGYWLSKAGYPILGAAANLGTGTIGTIEGIKGSAKDIKEGNIARGIGNGLLTAVGAASDVATARLLNKGYRATHAYNTVVPASYDNPKGRFKEFLSSMLENKKYSGETPEFYTGVGNLTANYLDTDVKNAEIIAAKGREDAFRIYLGLEPKNNIYIKNDNGTYSYNLNTLKELSEGTWHPADGVLHDSFTGAGGLADVNLQLNTEKAKFFGTTQYTPGYYTIEDLWDLHPFRREGDTLLDRYQHKADNFFSRIHTKLYDKGVLGMDARYPGSSIVKEFENNTINRWRNRPPLKKAVKKLSDKLVNFEVGPVLGGKPFMMRTELPVTRKISLEPVRLDLNNPSGIYKEIIINHPKLITGNEQLPYFDSYYDHLPMLFSKSDFNDVDLSEFLNSNLYTTPIKKKKALGGPLVQSAKKYGEGGSMGSEDNFLKKAYHGFLQAINIEDTPKEKSAKRAAKRYSTYGYIGGNPRQVRQKYFDIDREFTDSVNSISQRYGLSPSVVASRIAEEGPVDHAIKKYNNKDTQGIIISDDGKTGTYGPLWGIDDFYTRVNNGDVKITTKAPYSYEKLRFKNEKGRITETITSPQWWFGIEATAAELKARRDKLKKENPWMSNADLDAAAAMSFNYGETGVKNHINSKKAIPSRYKPYIKTK